uniref:PEGA domain-containing protein n=1 Tax=Byssovorax cruenta TaxID=293647 RepID=A0A3S5GXX9_9BACT|nr:hypothetical protein [Byssovorax cruenta]
MTIGWPDGTSGTRSRRRRVALSAAAVALSLLTGAGAGAQTKEELDRARTLFKEGVALSAANNCAAALTKFYAVANVKMTAQVAFNIGECEERVGKLVSALGNYRVAASMAQGDPKAKDVASRVGARIEALEARVPKLTVKRGRGAETASIELDGSELGAAQLGAEVPVDPGAHTVVARVEGKELLRETVTLAEGEAKPFDVDLPLPEPKPEPKVEAPEEPAEKGGSKVPGAAVLGAGVASGVASAVFWALRGGTIGELDQKCGGDLTCPPSAQPIADRGRVFTGLAEVTTAVAVVGVVTGIVLLVKSGATAPPKQAARAHGPRGAESGRGLSLSPSAPGASIGGLSLVGRF